MSFPSLKLVTQSNKQDITEYLLVPDLLPEQIYSSLYNAVFLAALWRIHRERPYVVASVDKGKPGNIGREDLAYIEALPCLSMSGFVRASFIPSSEGEFLLFLPKPPASVIPCWPDMVSKLNGILIGQIDEYITLQTVDTSIMALINNLSLLRD
jgi:hypothetical protein